MKINKNKKNVMEIKKDSANQNQIKCFVLLILSKSENFLIILYKKRL